MHLIKLRVVYIYNFINSKSFNLNIAITFVYTPVYVFMKSIERRKHVGNLDVNT
jgi:hypothetical protein